MKQKKRPPSFWLGLGKGLALFVAAFGLVTRNQALQWTVAAVLVILCVIDIVLDEKEKRELKNDRRD